MKHAISFQFIIFNLLAACAIAQNIDVDITPSHETNRFLPNQTLGAGIDRISTEAIDKDLVPAALEKVFTDGPIAHSTKASSQNTTYDIPAASIVVLRGKLGRAAK